MTEYSASCIKTTWPLRLLPSLSQKHLCLRGPAESPRTLTNYPTLLNLRFRRTSTRLCWRSLAARTFAVEHGYTASTISKYDYEQSSDRDKQIAPSLDFLTAEHWQLQPLATPNSCPWTHT